MSDKIITADELYKLLRALNWYPHYQSYYCGQDCDGKRENCQHCNGPTEDGYKFSGYTYLGDRLFVRAE